MIDIYYNETISTTRLVKEDVGYKQTHEVFLENIPCHVQPLESSLSEDIEGGFGKDFLVFCDVTDIQEGDRVVREVDGLFKTYRITAVDRMEFLNQSHMEIQIRIFES